MRSERPRHEESRHGARGCLRSCGPPPARCTVARSHRSRNTVFRGAKRVLTRERASRSAPSALGPLRTNRVLPALGLRLGTRPGLGTRPLGTCRRCLEPVSRPRRLGRVPWVLLSALPRTCPARDVRTRRRAAEEPRRGPREFTSSWRGGANFQGRWPAEPAERDPRGEAERSVEAGAARRPEKAHPSNGMDPIRELCGRRAELRSSRYDGRILGARGNRPPRVDPFRCGVDERLDSPAMLRTSTKINMVTRGFRG